MKKIILSLLSVFCIMSCTMGTTLAAQRLNNAEPYGNEIFTVSQDFGIGEIGYVTCKVKVNYNVQGRYYKVSNVSVTPHFAAECITYKIVGTPTSNPKSGEKITGGYVNVTFKYSNGLFGTFERHWTKTCKVKI